jgi:hypothetical protein
VNKQINYFVSQSFPPVSASYDKKESQYLLTGKKFELPLALRLVDYSYEIATEFFHAPRLTVLGISLFFNPFTFEALDKVLSRSSVHSALDLVSHVTLL